MQTMSFLEECRPSRLTLGTVQFGLNYGIANRAGQPGYRTVCDILACAAAGGVNCLDTAAIYGSSEEVLGRALRATGLGNRMTVVSKVAAIAGQPAAAEAAAFIRASVETSLRRLQLDVLPLCLFHKEADYQYIEELWRLRDAGLIRYAGVSADNAPGPARTMAEAGRVAALQLPMNILDQRHERSGVLAAAAARRMTVFARSVYLQGLLLMPEENIIPELAAAIPARRQLQALAEQAGMGMDELALRYILSLEGVTSVITGVETVEQMRRNTQLFALGALPPDLLAAARQAVPDLPDALLTPKTWSNSMPSRPKNKPGPAIRKETDSRQ